MNKKEVIQLESLLEKYFKKEFFIYRAFDKLNQTVFDDIEDSLFQFLNCEGGDEKEMREIIISHIISVFILKIDKPRH